MESRPSTGLLECGPKGCLGLLQVAATRMVKSQPEEVHGWICKVPAARLDEWRHSGGRQFVPGGAEMAVLVFQQVEVLRAFHSCEGFCQVETSNPPQSAQLLNQPVRVGYVQRPKVVLVDAEFVDVAAPRCGRHLLCGGQEHYQEFCSIRPYELVEALDTLQGQLFCRL